MGNCNLIVIAEFLQQLYSSDIKVESENFIYEIKLDGDGALLYWVLCKVHDNLFFVQKKQTKGKRNKDLQICAQALVISSDGTAVVLIREL